MQTSRSALIFAGLMAMFGASLTSTCHALDPSQQGQQGQQTVSIPSRYVPNSIVFGVWQVLDTQTGLYASTAAYHTEAEASAVANKMNVDAWKSKKTIVPVNERALKDGDKRAQDTPDTLVPKTPTTSISSETVKEKMNPNYEDGHYYAEPKRPGPLPTTGKGNDSGRHQPKPR